MIVDTNGMEIEDKAWTRDGRSILFSANVGNGKYSLFIADAGSRKGWERFAGDEVQAMTFDVSPIQPILVYSPFSPDKYGFYLMDLDKRQPYQQLVELGSDETVFNPQWSPDGNLIAYLKSDKATLHICILKPDGYTTCFYDHPKLDTITWLANDWLLFSVIIDNEKRDYYSLDISQATPAPELFLDLAFGMDVWLGAPGESVVWATPAPESAPTEPPAVIIPPVENGRIVFDAMEPNQNGDGGIYTIEPDGSNQVRLTGENNPDIWGPCWSPDKSQVAFASRRAGGTTADIYVMDADGGNIRQLTDNSADYVDDYEPAWSPDGSRIAFVSDRQDNLEIYFNEPGWEQRHTPD